MAWPLKETIVILRIRYELRVEDDGSDEETGPEGWDWPYILATGSEMEPPESVEFLFSTPPEEVR